MADARSSHPSLPVVPYHLGHFGTRARSMAENVSGLSWNNGAHSTFGDENLLPELVAGAPVSLYAAPDNAAAAAVAASPAAATDNAAAAVVAVSPAAATPQA